MKIFRGRLHARHGPPLGGVTAVAVLAALLVVLPASAQTSDEAVADLRVRAAQGEAEAQNNFGLMYVNGHKLDSLALFLATVPRQANRAWPDVGSPAE